MRILQIMAGKGLGGAETYSCDVMLALHQAGVDQCVVMSDRAPRYAELKAAGIRMEPGVLSCPLRCVQRWRLRRLIAREQPNLIHAWMRRAASLLPRDLPMPVIGWFGGYYDPSHFGACDVFVGVTQGIVQHMRDHGVPEKNAFYIPTFPVVREDTPIARDAFDTPVGGKIVLALSRLHPKKGLDTLIRAAARLPGVYVWLAGEGPLRRDLEKLVDKLGMKDRVRFLGWCTDRGALLRAADLCCLPSRYEPFGTVILEAWAARCPLVACRSAGPNAHVRHEDNGLLVTVDDDQDLTRALHRALYDADLAAKMVEHGYLEYQNQFTREKVTAQMTALYADRIARGRAKWPQGT